MARLLSYLHLFVFFLVSVTVIVHSSEDYSSFDPVLEPTEEGALYSILEAANPDVDWRSAYPDDLCTAGPHGIICEVDTEKPTTSHVVQLNLGWVSEYSNNPHCSSTNASFSPSLTLLPFLSKLFVHNCFTSSTSFATLPSYIWSLGPNLEELVLHSNPSLVGFLPSEISNLVSIRRLIISGTGISGVIPTEIGKLEHLQQIDLSNNDLRGQVPSSLCRLKDVVILDLSQNSLSGSIPSDIGNLTKLSKLDLSDNNLTGNIPISTGALEELEMLDTSNNQISGGFPIIFKRMKNLKNLHLQGNPIGGSLSPEFFFGLENLVSLHLSHTKLSGRIPTTMNKLVNLSYLALDHNNLSGEIPPTIARLPNIHGIDLSYNSLSGLVPFSPIQITKLGQRLKLEGNSEICLHRDISQEFAMKIGIPGCNASPSTFDVFEQSQVRNDGVYSSISSKAIDGKGKIIILVGLLVHLSVFFS